MARNIKFTLREYLYKSCEMVEEEKDKYVVNPSKNFTRNRKLTMADTMYKVSILEGNSLPKELYDVQSSLELEKRISVPGYVQQRYKILPSAFYQAFNNFNKSTKHYDTKVFKERHLIAVDDSTANLAKQLNTKTSMQNGDNEPYNQFHINASFDVLNKTYKDVVVQPQPENYEVKAARQMVKRKKKSHGIMEIIIQ